MLGTEFLYKIKVTFNKKCFYSKTRSKQIKNKTQVKKIENIILVIFFVILYKGIHTHIPCSPTSTVFRYNPVL